MRVHDRRGRPLVCLRLRCGSNRWLRRTSPLRSILPHMSLRWNPVTRVGAVRRRHCRRAAPYVRRQGCSEDWPRWVITHPGLGSPPGAAGSDGSGRCWWTPACS